MCVWYSVLLSFHSSITFKRRCHFVVLCLMWPVRSLKKMELFYIFVFSHLIFFLLPLAVGWPLFRSLSPFLQCNLIVNHCVLDDFFEIKSNNHTTPYWDWEKMWKKRYWMMCMTFDFVYRWEPRVYRSKQKIPWIGLDGQIIRNLSLSL